MSRSKTSGRTSGGKTDEAKKPVAQTTHEETSTADQTPPAASATEKPPAETVADDVPATKAEAAPDNDQAPVAGTPEDIRKAVEAETPEEDVVGAARTATEVLEDRADATAADDPGREIPPHRSGGGAAPAAKDDPGLDEFPPHRSDGGADRAGAAVAGLASATSAAALATGQKDIETVIDESEELQSPSHPLRPYNREKSVRQNIAELTLIATALADIHNILGPMVGMPGELVALRELCGPAQNVINERINKAMKPA